MNRGQVRDEIRRMLRDTDTDSTRQRWTDTGINDRINIAQEKIVQQAGILETRITDNLVAGQSEYALPNIYLKDLGVYWYDGTYWKPLSKITTKELDLFNSTWLTTTGNSLNYYFLRHRNLLCVYPIPTFSQINGLKMDIIKRPNAMTLDEDIPFENVYEYSPFHDLIAIEVARTCLSDEGKDKEFIIKNNEFQLRIMQLRAQMTEEYDGTRIVNIYETPGCRKQPRRTR